MKRIKQIIEALGVISKSPASVVRDARDKIALGPSANSQWDELHRTLVVNIMNAVLVIAEEMERPAKAEETKS